MFIIWVINYIYFIKKLFKLMKYELNLILWNVLVVFIN